MKKEGEKSKKNEVNKKPSHIGGDTSRKATGLICLSSLVQNSLISLNQILPALFYHVGQSWKNQVDTSQGVKLLSLWNDESKSVPGPLVGQASVVIKTNTSSFLCSVFWDNGGVFSPMRVRLYPHTCMCVCKYAGKWERQIVNYTYNKEKHTFYPHEKYQTY